MMTDSEALDFLAGKLGGKAKIAITLKVKPQAVTNWYARGISQKRRAAIWMMIKNHGRSLPADWLLKGAA